MSRRVMVRLKVKKEVAELVWKCEREWRDEDISLDEGLSWLSNSYMLELSKLFYRREVLLQAWKKGGMSDARLERWHNLMRKIDAAIDRVVQALKERQGKHCNYVSPDL